MNVTVGSLGRRGDSEALIAIGLALRDRGHAVSFVSSSDGASSIESWRFPVRVLGGDYHDFLQSAAVSNALRAGHASAFLELIATYTHAARRTLRATMLAAAAGADAILMPTTLIPESLILTELLHKPVALVVTTPVLPASSEFAHPFISAWPFLPPMVNRLTHAAFDRKVSSGLRLSDDAEWRSQLGLPRPPKRFIREAARRRVPQLHVYSSRLFPRPADWPSFAHATGRIAVSPARRFAAGHGRLADDLVDWLDAGPPPVAIASSRLPLGDPSAYVAIARRLTGLLGVRVVVTGLQLPAGKTAGDEHVFVAGEVDHDQLFPRCRSAVHHGGAWTTAMTARAGIPAVVCSIVADQHLWGQRVRALGIGEHLPFARVDAPRLAHALRRLERSDVRQRARDIGSQIHAEDGTAAAVDLVERLAHGYGAPAPSPRPLR